MSKKQYIDNDVYNESKKRIKHIINTFDSVLVCFSGGKDSLAVLNLVQECYDEMGIKEKVKVVFRDEELIPDDVLEFVQDIYKSGKYDFRYYAIPLESNKFVMGKTYRYVQWDRNRNWLRQPPEFAITLPEDKYHEYSQYDADTFICQNEKGRVALINGIRADESIVRLQACMNKKNENYINATKDPRIKLCKPIYDWSEQDIFLYFYKKNIKYCVIYDLQTINGDGLRVSTPLHAESSKRFYKLKTLYPKYYQQLVDLFPEMLVQARYYTSMEKKSDFSEYEHSFDGIRQFIKDKITDKVMAKKALFEVNLCERTRKNKMKTESGKKNFGGYAVLYVFNQIANGNFKRHIMPKAKNSQDEIDYENM